MESLALRIIITVASLVNILIDCYNETVINNDGHIHIVAGIYEIIVMISIWFI